MNKKFLVRCFSLFTLLAMLTGSLWAFAPAHKAQAAFGERITISNGQFMAGGSRIWINGANTPWNNWNDFGGNYNATWWSDHFQQLHDSGVNAIRVWITCSGETGITISDAGLVSGATAQHWTDLDSFFAIAQQKQIYIMATLISFDHFKNTYTTYNKWRNWINSDTNIDSYTTNYLIPFVNRYKSNPYLWSIDLANEPDWIYENAENGQIPWARLQAYFARASRAIHENSPVLVTVGMGMPKYNAACASGCQGNMIADSALKAVVNDPEVYIDFYSSHYYPWQDPYFGGIPFIKSPAAYYGADPGKPSMIGETPATGSTGSTLAQDYENAYLNGWQGVMPWTSNGVDGNGGFNEVIGATIPFRNNHTDLVFPGASTGPTNTPTRTHTAAPATNTPTKTNTATRTNTAVNTSTPTRTITPGGPTVTRTRTPTVTNTATRTNTPTKTNTPLPITATPTTGSGSTCSPVTATITAPYSFDGAGSFCWQSSNLGGYINSWNTSSVTINGVNYTNVWMGSGSYPAKIGGYWYVSYNGPYAWSHFEAK